jgi:4-hydroxybenzoate polyprenyltransferase
MRSFLHFAAYSNLLIAAAALALAAMSGAQHGTMPHAGVLVLVFCGTFTAYYWIRTPALKAPRMPEDSRIVHWQRAWDRPLKWAAAFSGLVAAALAIFFLPLEAQLLIGVAAVLSIAYSFSGNFIVLSGPARGLRKIPGLKLLVIATSWMIVTHWVPLLALGSMPDLAGSIFRIAFVSALALLFDIRDSEKDAPHIQTIPVKYGSSFARLLAFILTGLAWTALLYQTWTLEIWSWWQFIGFWIVLEVTGIFIYFTRQKQPDLYYVVGVDSLPLFLGLAVIFLP